MSRTFSRSPREDAASAVRFARRAVQPDKVTPEWAVRAMEKHVRLWLNRSISMGLFCEAEREEYKAMVNDAARRAAELYRPGVRNAEGETSSPVHYVRQAVDNRMRTIVGRIVAFRRKYPAVPIVGDPPVEAKNKECISEEDVRLGDRCRSVRELEFVMDVVTLFRRLPPVCARFLRDRLAGYTREECAARVGLSTYLVRHNVIPAIREEAVRCGFEPRSMVEGARPWRKKKGKSSHGFPQTEV